MANQQGEFIWYELMTRDMAAAQAFYGPLLGWRFEDQSDAGYTLIVAGEEHAGGMLQLTDAMCKEGARPAWLGYIAVEDVDRSAARLKELGGSVLIDPRDIPHVGRFAMVADPQGLPFYIMRGSVEGGTSKAFSHKAMGHCAWNELTTVDQQGAIDFYGELFGWENRENMDMGAMGQYRFLHLGDDMIGAVSPCSDPQQTQSWTYYFHVPDIDAAQATIAENGGTIFFGPEVIPGDEYIIIGQDPDEAMFAVVGPRLK